MSDDAARVVMSFASFGFFGYFVQSGIYPARFLSDQVDVSDKSPRNVRKSIIID